MTRIIATFTLIICLLPVHAQEQDGRAIGNFFKASGTPVNPKVTDKLEPLLPTRGCMRFTSSL
jgi:hypothetical protein